VRRSRRRFWKSELDADKNSAYATLYHILVKLAKVLAPFTPFVTEVMYQNLVRSVYPQTHESIHHCSWPTADLATVDAKLLDEMSLARRIASLGLSARSDANLKVRQPLNKVLVHVGGKYTLRAELVNIIMDELNVKGFDFVEQEGKLVNYRILPDNKLLGPKYGARFPKVRLALQSANPGEVAARLRLSLPVELDVDGEHISLAPQEVLVQTQPVEGLAVAADKLITVGIDAVVTPELRSEGLAREIVRRVQAMRKDAGFNIEDRIFTYYTATGDLANVIAIWSAYICAETLTIELVAGQPPAEAHVEQHKVDGLELTLGVKKR
jgi:isoleucyl-tRNA synthetase